jgi:hypothetical protein
MLAGKLGFELFARRRGTEALAIVGIRRAIKVEDEDDDSEERTTLVWRWLRHSDMVLEVLRRNFGI